VPHEIEAKMKLSEAAELERRLAALGARPRMTVKETNTYFDTLQGSLRASDQGLRIRTEVQVGGPYRSTIITHKGPRTASRVKTRPETELPVEDADRAARLLAALGFVPVLTFEKLRRRWDFHGCHVDLDTLPVLGDFVEIEGPSEGDVLESRRRLSLDGLPLISDSYISMLMAYRADRGLVTDRFTLDMTPVPPRP
jgi:predicted adenylyl cyclase CyaB